MLKRLILIFCYHVKMAAAFGRLCVETSRTAKKLSNHLAAAFGRLCVETDLISDDIGVSLSSRLRAAVC